HPTRPHHALRKWRPSRRLRQVSVPGRLRSPRRAGGGEIASLNFQISASAESVDPTDFCNEIGPTQTPATSALRSPVRGKTDSLCSARVVPGVTLSGLSDLQATSGLAILTSLF